MTDAIAWLTMSLKIYYIFKPLLSVYYDDNQLYYIPKKGFPCDFSQQEKTCFMPKAQGRLLQASFCSTGITCMFLYIQTFKTGVVRLYAHEAERTGLC